jgi:hypothetical protein
MAFEKRFGGAELVENLVVGHAVSIAVRGRVNRPLAGPHQHRPAKAGSRP